MSHSLENWDYVVLLFVCFSVLSKNIKWGKIYINQMHLSRNIIQSVYLVSSLFLITYFQPGMVIHSFDSSTWEAEKAGAGISVLV